MRHSSKEIGDAVARLNVLWSELKATSKADGEVPCDSPQCEEFIEVAKQTQPLTDELITQRDTKPSS